MQAPPLHHRGGARLIGVALILLLTTIGFVRRQAESVAPQGASAPSLSRPAFSLANIARAVQPVRTIRRIAVPPAVTPEWSAQAKQKRWGYELPDGRTCLVVTGQAGTRVAYRGNLDLETFERILVQIWMPQEGDVALSLHRGEQLVYRSPPQRVAADQNVQSIPILLPPTPIGIAPCDRLTVHYTGKHLYSGLVGFELQRYTLEHRLPLPDEATGMIAIGADARRGVGLHSERPLTLTCFPERGQRLRFSYGRMGYTQGASELRVHLLRDGELVRTESFHLAADRPTPWTAVELDLTNCWHQPLELQFELYSEIGPAICALGEVSLLRPQPKASTVVLITSDTHRRDHLGVAHSGVELSTPNLDALAARGLLFEDCVATSNLTVPSHVAMMTGVHPRDTDILSNHSRLADDAPTLAEAFRAAGYRTVAAVSAAKLGDARCGLGQGFDRMALCQAGQRDSSETLAALVPILEDERDLPLFLWLHVFDAHSPYELPAASANAYWPEDRDAFAQQLPELPQSSQPLWLPGLRDIGYVEALYKAEVSYLDERLATILDMPRVRAGIVAFTADHGESLTGHEVIADHRELFPDTLDVPLILTYPGAPGGLRTDAPVDHLNLGRTLLDLAQLQATVFPGKTLLSHPEGAPQRNSKNAPRYAIAALGESVSLRTSRWFAVLHLRDHSRGPTSATIARHTFELYDLESDPDCLLDVSEQEDAPGAQLRMRLGSWIGRRKSRGWKEEGGLHTAKEMDQLAAMGYSSNTADTGEDLWLDPACDCEPCAQFRIE